MFIISEYHHFEDDDPVITLEVLSESNQCDPDQTAYTAPTDPQAPTNTAPTDSTTELTTGLHFLNEETKNLQHTEEKEEPKDVQKGRSDMLEYMMRNDGSVVCKLCGEILQSRTHWYRHKYKVHVVHSMHPAPIFQCDQCLVYFKSRKGYIGHLASRHSDVLSDSGPASAQAETVSSDPTPTVTITPLPLPRTTQIPAELDQTDPEMAIPKTSVPKYETSAIRQALAKAVEVKKVVRKSSAREDASSNTTTTSSSEVDEKRTREEKLVADIIARVRQECEAQGSGGPARRGYSRKYTVMNT